MKVYSLIILILFFYSFSFSQSISLDGIGSYSQDFNSLSNSGTSSTVPAGWAFSESGTSGNNDGLYTPGTGSSNQGDTYSFGASSSTERAFGELTTGTLNSIIGCQFVNQTSVTITQVPVSYVGEQWRLGAIGRVDKLDFQYSLDATSLTTGTWTNVDNLDFMAPVSNGTVGSLDGNDSANRIFISFTITGLNILNNSIFWFRWVGTDASSNDDGLAIDDFSIVETNLPVELSSFSAVVLDNGVKLNWRTETEVSNYGFEVERCQMSDVKSQTEWTKVGFVEGNGNSNSPKDYLFIDENVRAGKYAYRLKQIDTDGEFEYSKIIEVDLGSPAKFELSQNYPNPFNPVTTIQFSVPQAGKVKLSVYNLLGEEVTQLVNGFKDAGVHTVNFNAGNLNSGLYIYKIEANNFIQSRKMMLMK